MTNSVIQRSGDPESPWRWGGWRRFRGKVSILTMLAIFVLLRLGIEARGIGIVGFWRCFHVFLVLEEGAGSGQEERD